MKVDNQSALAVMRNPEHHGRMKHIDIVHHWIRDAVHEGKIEVEHLPTELMTADILTKPLPRQLIERHRSELGLA